MLRRFGAAFSTSSKEALQGRLDGPFVLFIRATALGSCTCTSTAPTLRSSPKGWSVTLGGYKRFFPTTKTYRYVCCGEAIRRPFGDPVFIFTSGRRRRLTRGVFRPRETHSSPFLDGRETLIRSEQRRICRSFKGWSISLETSTFVINGPVGGGGRSVYDDVSPTLRIRGTP